MGKTTFLLHQTSRHRWIKFSKWNGLSGGLRYRYLKNRPANEDNSIVAKGYAIADFNINYEFKVSLLGFSRESIEYKME
jgi:outer membrane receptor protein involved in Fe transport